METKILNCLIVIEIISLNGNCYYVRAVHRSQPFGSQSLVKF